MNDTTGHNTLTVTRVEVIDAIETAFKKAPLTKEDLVAAAFNDASRRVEATIAEKMGGMTAGLGLPAGFKLPF